MSPPSAFPSHETSDSLFHPDSPSLSGPVNAQETTRNRIIREIVETERKYVQDLEHMQVRSQIIRVALALAYVFATEICKCSCCKQRYRPRHYPSSLPRTQQTTRFPAPAPHKA